jgi:hypothetical protein
MESVKLLVSSWTAAEARKFVVYFLLHLFRNLACGSFLARTTAGVKAFFDVFAVSVGWAWRFSLAYRLCPVTVLSRGAAAGTPSGSKNESHFCLSAV